MGSAGAIVKVKVARSLTINKAGLIAKPQTLRCLAPHPRTYVNCACLPQTTMHYELALACWVEHNQLDFFVSCLLKISATSATPLRETKRVQDKHVELWHSKPRYLSIRLICWYLVANSPSDQEQKGTAQLATDSVSRTGPLSGTNLSWRRRTSHKQTRNCWCSPFVWTVPS